MRSNSITCRCGHSIDEHCGCGTHCFAHLPGPAKRIDVPKVLQATLGEWSEQPPLCRCDGLVVETTPRSLN